MAIIEIDNISKEFSGDIVLKVNPFVKTLFYKN